MSHVNDRVVRSLWVVLLSCASLLACSSDKAKTKANTGDSTKELTKEVTPDTVIDVAFLVEACVDAGFADKSCTCVGEEAKAILGKEIIEKMRSAPGDDDPAFEGYYGGVEITKIMELVGVGETKCGVEG